MKRLFFSLAAICLAACMVAQVTSNPNPIPVGYTERIREKYNQETTVIILTSYSWDDIVDEAYHAGVDSFLSKPLFAASVIEEFKSALKKKDLDARQKQET